MAGLDKASGGGIQTLRSAISEHASALSNPEQIANQQRRSESS